MSIFTIPKTPPRRGRIAREYRSRAAAWLKDHPGAQPKIDVARACSIPAGSIGRVFADAVFLTSNAGSVELREGANADTHRRADRYGRDILSNARYAVFAELTVKQPQTLDQLVRELKFERALVAEALEWNRFESVRGGYVIGCKGGNDEAEDL